MYLTGSYLILQQQSQIQKISFSLTRSSTGFTVTVSAYKKKKKQ